jgi:hypothetical protein
MARNPRTAAFCRVVGGVLLANGFEQEKNGRHWWLCSESGDYVSVAVQISTRFLRVVYVNIAVVPGSTFAFVKWLWPNTESVAGEGPLPEAGYLLERVRPVEAPRDTNLMLSTVERAEQLGAFVARDLADAVLPRFLRYLDRDALLETLDSMAAMAEVALRLRAGFLAETGDAEGADRAYGSADEDDEYQAPYREWLREYAAAHQQT